METNCINELINTIWRQHLHYLPGLAHRVCKTDNSETLKAQSLHSEHKPCIANTINCSEKKLVILPNEMALFKKFCKLPPKQAYFWGEVGRGDTFHT